MPDTALTAIDQRAFRDALGSFVTGVTIVTTRDAAGNDVGLTANSFNSVSLNPPLVLWSLALNSAALPAFRQAEAWAVHILAREQEPLSARFATRGIDKFAGLDLARGPAGIPLLQDCAARFICRTAYEYDGGDHAIFVGEVREFDRGAAAPLAYHQGRYAGVVNADAAEEPADFAAHFLGHWLGLAHAAVFGDVRREYRRRGLTGRDYAVLVSLGLSGPRAVAEVLQRAASGGLDAPEAALAAAVESGLLAEEGGRVRLTKAGRAQAVELVAVAQASQMRIEERLSGAEVATLRHLLQRLVG